MGVFRVLSRLLGVCKGFLQTRLGERVDEESGGGPDT